MAEPPRPSAPAVDPRPRPGAAAAAAVAPGAGDRLPRQLGVWSSTALVVGFMIGAGIFRVPGAVAAGAGSASRAALVWVAGGVVALCGALSFAELGAMFPRAGGVYVYLREAYGSLVAFLAGWTALVTFPASLGALATVVAEYLGEFVPLAATATRVVAAAAIVAVAGAAYRSTRAASALQGAATLAKVLALVVVVALAFALGDASSGAGATPTAGADSGGVASWPRVGLALITALYAYSGWQQLAYLAGEVREPGRTFPRAVVTGVIIVVTVYLAVNAAYLHVLSYDALAHSPLVAADAMRQVVGAAGTSVVSGLIVLSAFGTLVANSLAYPRLFYAMAEDGLFFRSLAATHARHRTPHVAVAFLAAVGVAFVSVRTFEQLAQTMVVSLWPFLALGVLAVPVLRRRRPELPRPYRTPGYPFVPFVFVAASLALIGSAVAARPGQTLASFGFTLLGVPAYLLWRRAGRRGRVPRPAPPPATA